MAERPIPSVGARSMSETWPPAHAELLVSFEVAGSPRGAGSKDAIPLGRWRVIGGERRFVPVTRDNGVPIVNVVDTAGDGGEAWSEEVRRACALALDKAHEMFDGPIAVRVTFFGKSPQTRYGTGRNADKLKDSADRRPHRSELPDGTKLARRLEDALNGLCWTDDRRVCDMWWSRDFARHPGARVDIYGMPARFCDVPGEHGAVAFPDQLVIIPANGAADTDTSGLDSALLERARRAAGAGSPGGDDGSGEAAGDEAIELQARREAVSDADSGGGVCGGVYPLGG